MKKGRAFPRAYSEEMNQKRENSEKLFGQNLQILLSKGLGGREKKQFPPKGAKSLI